MDGQLTYRLIVESDNKRIAEIIKQVMTAYDCVGEGYSIEDKEVDMMYQAYADDRSRYYVIELNGRVVGGAGISQLAGSDETVCEVKKMYFLDEGRGQGLGSQLMKQLLKDAKEIGYQTCYLETVKRMKAANNLYSKFGFKKNLNNIGNTGHCGCDTFYSLQL